MRIALAFLLGSLAPISVLMTGCGVPAKEGRYPARAEGCDVKVFQEIPPMPTDNIGPVMATCGADVSNDDCMRTLKDQACKLGADIIWGTDDVPSMALGKKKLAGRAAHTKTGK